MGALVTDVVDAPATPGAADGARRQRVGRALAASGAATSVALLSHLLGGGTMPGVLGVVVPLLLATQVCLVLAPMRLSWVRLSVSVVVSQLLFHTLFSLGSSGSGTRGPAMGGHAHGGTPTLVADAEAMTHAGHTAGSMRLSHAVAAVVTVLALRHGEVALARLTAALDRAVHRVRQARVPVLPVLPHTTTAPRRDEGSWRPVARVLTAASVVRRGPPEADSSVFS